LKFKSRDDVVESTADEFEPSAPFILNLGIDQFHWPMPKIALVIYNKVCAEVRT